MREPAAYTPRAISPFRSSITCWYLSLIHICDSLSFVPYNTKIVNCYDHYEELACCDVIVNAAGKRCV